MYCLGHESEIIFFLVYTQTAINLKEEFACYARKCPLTLT